MPATATPLPADVLSIVRATFLAECVTDASPLADRMRVAALAIDVARAQFPDHPAISDLTIPAYKLWVRKRR